MSEIKDKLIEDYKNLELTVGMEGYVNSGVLDGFGRQKFPCKILKILSSEQLEIYVNRNGYYYHYTISSKDFQKDYSKIGANPFSEETWEKRIRSSNFDNEGVLYACGYDKKNRNRASYTNALGFEVPELNFNPYVIDKNGEKRYYQRDFCWTLEDKQLLIQSIYNHMNCGTILLRVRSWENIESEVKKGNKEIAFKDVVDGKQRINCILSFVNDEFKDSYGNYFSDLSDSSRMKFFRGQNFTYMTMEEGTTDEEVIKAFLNVNFTGKQMSKEHIKYVEEINKMI